MTRFFEKNSLKTEKSQMMRIGVNYVEEVIKDVEKMSLVPHYTIDQVKGYSRYVLLIKKSKKYPPFLSKMMTFIKSAQLIIYDPDDESESYTKKEVRNNEELSCELDINVKQDKETSFIENLSNEWKKLSRSNELEIIISKMNEKGYKHTCFIHYCPSLSSIGNVKEHMKTFSQNGNSYYLIKASISNGKVIDELARLRQDEEVFDSVVESPFNCIVYLRPEEFEVYPPCKEMTGIVVKIPKTYYTSRKSWEMNERPQFYIISPMKLTMGSKKLKGQRRIAMKCNDGSKYYMFKEQRLITRTLQSALDEMESQMIAKGIIDEWENKVYNVNEVDVFIETNYVIHGTEAISAIDLMKIPRSRCGTLERYLGNPEAKESEDVKDVVLDKSDNFKALQHWFYLFTAKRMVIDNMKVSNDVEGTLNKEKTTKQLTCTSIVLNHESLTKFYYTNTNHSHEGIERFENIHKCNELCQKYPFK